MPKDDPVLKETIKMVVATLIGCAASSPVDAALIAKAARTGGLLQMAKVADANHELGKLRGSVSRRRCASGGRERIAPRLR